ncbi:hypothetical protein [Haloferula sp.]|uniref:hypothetical protein n=1 Tax=Haloferula sp. TaxID=2497595 RepID=UPI003C71B0A4
MLRCFQGFVLLFLASLLSSCGSEDGVAESATPPPRNGFEQKSGELFDDDSDKMIGRYAKTNPMMQNGGDKPAEESAVGENRFFEGELAKREFAAKDYTKKSFWGSKDYAKQVYGGNTDGSRFQQGSRFDSQGAPEGGLTSAQSGSRYATTQQVTGAAREAGNANISKVSDAKTDARRESYRQPEIRDWREQRGLTIDDTRSMLGRSD